MEPSQQQALAAWVENACRAAGVTVEMPLRCEPLPGDAGFRRYFRVAASQPPVMAVFSPPETEANHHFLAVSAILAGGGVRVPGILATEPDQGFMLLEDLGDQLLLPLLQGGDPEAVYPRALAMLKALQAIPVGGLALPRYDHERLRQEMALFPEWMVTRLLGIKLSAAQEALLEDTFDRLLANALEQPVALVHRDYHSRNLMLAPGKELATIDFQDAVIGPVTYDLVSILRDCYIAWPQARVETWVKAYLADCQATGLLSADLAPDRFLRWFDLMGLQRHIKVLGIFSRLNLRDNKPRYLDDLPLVIAYTLGVARRYPELAGFAEWFEVELMPAIRSCHWYRPVTIEGLYP